MHPFTQSPRCPKCDKAVYLAEQAIGPGRKLYHKPCLACMSCNKRLDSYTLLEHDQQPYCKSCHLKNFGTANLRHANLPQSIRSRDSSPSPASRSNTIDRTWSPSPAPTESSSNALPRLQPNRSYTSPKSPTFPNSSSEDDPDTSLEDDELHDSFAAHTLDGDSTNTGRPGIGSIPRTVPLPPHLGSNGRHHASNSLGSIPTSYTGSSDPGSNSAIPPPLMQTATGTRYGIGLTGGIGVQTTGGGSPRKWTPAQVPSCARCGKSVYFAEQAKAVGKIFHRVCLRCVQCGTTLDSNRLRDHDGDPYCVSCHKKQYGPAGNGYALLGKAGG